MKKAGVLSGSFAEPPHRLRDRRTGIERREFSYSYCIPEQRKHIDRRSIKNPAVLPDEGLEATDLSSPEFD